MATLFTIIFALACLATFALGYEKQWKTARIVAAMTAILSFLLALAAVGLKK